MYKVVQHCTNKIWVFHNASMDMEILEDEAQFLHCKFTSPSSSEPFLFTFIYAKCRDFHIIAASSEKIGGNPPDMYAINDFTECIMDCNLIDVGFSSLPFTWQKGVVKERLDRTLFNQRWVTSYPDI